VWADYASVRRLTWILLDAIKYTSSPGMIQVCVKAKDQGVFVTVEDSGIGVSAWDLPHIFDDFTGRIRPEAT
jgi:signal transduction histidine kinase